MTNDGDDKDALDMLEYRQVEHGSTIKSDHMQISTNLAANL